MQLEMAQAASKFISQIATTPVSYPGITFNPPPNGAIYVKYDYMPALSESMDLSRRCRSYRGLIQVSVIFPPDTGTTKAMTVAKGIADRMIEGLELDTGYLYDYGVIHAIQKSDTGYMIPVRCYLQAFETKEL